VDPTAGVDTGEEKTPYTCRESNTILTELPWLIFCSESNNMQY